MERRHAFRPTRSALASGLAVLVAGLVACGDPGTIENHPVPVSSGPADTTISTASSSGGGAPAAELVQASLPSLGEVGPSGSVRASGPATLAEGLKLRDEGKLAEAEDTLVRAADADRKSSRILVNLARVRLSREDGTGGLEAAERALATSPSSVEALHQKGRALAMLGRGDEAVEVLKTARELTPEHGQVANTLGWLLLTRGDAQGAVPHLEAARDRLPDVGYVRNNLGVAYERTGRRDEAIAEYRAAVAAGDSGAKASASLVRLNASVTVEGLGSDVGEDEGKTSQGSDPAEPGETPPDVEGGTTGEGCPGC